MRLALAAVAAGIGYVAVIQSLAMVIQHSSPVDAHTLAPANGFITGRLAGHLSGPQATARDRAQADSLARLALQQDPTSLDAAAALGLNAQIRGDADFARQAFSYSEALSRRDLQTQIWAIGDTILRDDVPAVLSHYDIALRTSQTASTLLFPILTTAIADPAIQTALVKRFVLRPPWMNDFLAYAVSNGDPEITVSLLQSLARHDLPVPARDSAAIVNALLSTNKPNRAWAYYASLHPGADRHQSRDPHFNNTTEDPSLFDWVPTNDGDVSAAIQRSGSAGVLTLAAPPSIGGQAVRQFEMLPTGTYLLDGRSEGLDQLGDARPYWSLTCLDGRDLGRVDVPNGNDGRFAGRFAVPANCPVQVLALTLLPTSAVSGISGQIDQALLRPAG